MLPKSDPPLFEKILGINFYVGPPAGAVELALQGGLIVVPSAPVLVNATVEPATQAALLDSDLAISDSGLMILFWSLTRRKKLRRLSGLEYLKLLLAEPTLRCPGAVYWVMPNEAALQRNKAWLAGEGYPVVKDDFYVAPLYGPGPLNDQKLLQRIEERRPGHVILAIGGGVQERLGHFLKSNLSYRPGIHGIGAAIGFLNGDQVHIPAWADRLFLGWLFRCLRSPSRFIPRYWAARSLVWILIRHGDGLPNSH